MNRDTALWEAIDEADEQTVRRLLGEHPDLVKATDGYGLTPLMRATSSMSRTVCVIKAVLEAGADVNRQTAEGYTALHFAIDVNGEANLNTEEVIQTLVAAGADLTLRQHYGWTPLLRAVEQGTAAEVKALLAAGANPNETIPFDTMPGFNAGQTTLMAALTNPEAEVIVAALLKAGADPARCDLNGMTFFEYAELTERESDPDDFATSVRRCAQIAREFTKNRGR